MSISIFMFLSMSDPAIPLKYNYHERKSSCSIFSSVILPVNPVEITKATE
jgi:hypothetical protein